MSPTQENSFTREMGRIAESLSFERNQLLQKVQQLEEAGDRIVKLVNEVYAMMGGPCMLQDAVKEWEKAKGEAE
jgi:biotin operon repressor